MQTCTDMQFFECGRKSKHRAKMERADFNFIGSFSMKYEPDARMLLVWEQDSRRD